MVIRQEIINKIKYEFEQIEGRCSHCGRIATRIELVGDIESDGTTGWQVDATMICEHCRKETKGKLAYTVS